MISDSGLVIGDSGVRTSEWELAEGSERKMRKLLDLELSKGGAPRKKLQPPGCTQGEFPGAACATWPPTYT